MFWYNVGSWSRGRVANFVILLFSVDCYERGRERCFIFGTVTGFMT